MADRPHYVAICRPVPHVARVHHSCSLGAGLSTEEVQLLRHSRKTRGWRGSAVRRTTAKRSRVPPSGADATAVIEYTPFSRTLCSFGSAASSSAETASSNKLSNKLDSPVAD